MRIYEFIIILRSVGMGVGVDKAAVLREESANRTAPVKLHICITDKVRAG
jgi:hypothetical protein